MKVSFFEGNETEEYDPEHPYPSDEAGSANNLAITEANHRTLPVFKFLKIQDCNKHVAAWKESVAKLCHDPDSQGLATVPTEAKPTYTVDPPVLGKLTSKLATKYDPKYLSKLKKVRETF